MEGGGVSEAKKMQLIFQNVFFKKPYRIILGPPKPVFHLVWSGLGRSTAIKTALKVALYDFFDGPLGPLNGQFMAKVDNYNSIKEINLLIRPSVIFFASHRFNFQKMEVNFFISQGRTQRGGVEGVMS